jgi:hypothetical protein
MPPTPVPSTSESLLGHVFDQYQNLMQIARCVREMTRQCRVARPRILELSRRATGLEDYLPEAEIVRHATHEDEYPNPPAFVALPFPDGAFDACVVTDAYEHIPAEQRPDLLREMTRVTRSLVLLGCPIRSELVTRFDRIVFDFIWGKYGERFGPLSQHVEFGLEPLDQVLASFAAHGADRAVALPCNYVYRWIHQILVYFDLQHGHPRHDLYEPLNRIYNERLSQFDYREPCYRYLIAAALDPRLDVDAFLTTLQGRCETPAVVAEAEGTLIEAFRTLESRLGDELRASGEAVASLQRELDRVVGEFEVLNQDRMRMVGEIDFLNKDRGRLVDEMKLLNEDRLRMVDEIDFLNKDRVRLVDEVDGVSKDRARLSDQNARLTQELVHLRRHPWRALIARWSGSPR